METAEARRRSSDYNIADGGFRAFRRLVAGSALPTDQYGFPLRRKWHRHLRLDPRRRDGGRFEFGAFTARRQFGHCSTDEGRQSDLRPVSALFESRVSATYRHALLHRRGQFADAELELYPRGLHLIPDRHPTIGQPN